MRARFDPNEAVFSDVTTSFEMSKSFSGGRHFGSRLVGARDGTLFFSIRDHSDREQAQNTKSHNGTVIRITKPGAVQNDKPFIGKPDQLPEIWSYGHCNPQDMTLDLKGNLWVSEDGARGGDEVNKITKGANYGWPKIAYGRHYRGRKIGMGTENHGTEQPQYFWDLSIASSGYLIYSGKQNRQ